MINDPDRDEATAESKSIETSSINQNRRAAESKAAVNDGRIIC